MFSTKSRIVTKFPNSVSYITGSLNNQLPKTYIEQIAEKAATQDTERLATKFYRYDAIGCGLIKIGFGTLIFGTIFEMGSELMGIDLITPAVGKIMLSSIGGGLIGGYAMAFKVFSAQGKLDQKILENLSTNERKAGIFSSLKSSSLTENRD